MPTQREPVARVAEQPRRPAPPHRRRSRSGGAPAPSDRRLTRLGRHVLHGGDRRDRGPRAWQATIADDHRDQRCPRATRTNTVRGLTTRPAGRQVEANRRQPRLERHGQPDPGDQARRPRRPALMTSDSPRTAAITWPRLAPTARSRASSRSRCATVIENVLKMTNAATNNAMNAEHEQEHADEARASWWMVCWPSAVTACPLATSTPGLWMAARRRLTSWDCETPGAACTSICVDLARLAEHPGRGDRGKRGNRRAERAVRAAPGGDAGDGVGGRGASG